MSESQIGMDSLVNQIKNLSPEDKEIVLNQLDVVDMLNAISRRYTELLDGHIAIQGILNRVGGN